MFNSTFSNISAISWRPVFIFRIQETSSRPACSESYAFDLIQSISIQQTAISSNDLKTATYVNADGNPGPGLGQTTWLRHKNVARLKQLAPSENFSILMIGSPATIKMQKKNIENPAKGISMHKDHPIPQKGITILT